MIADRGNGRSRNQNPNIHHGDPPRRAFSTETRSHGENRGETKSQSKTKIKTREQPRNQRKIRAEWREPHIFFFDHWTVMGFRRTIMRLRSEPCESLQFL